jgi:hypothetical protein
MGWDAMLCYAMQQKRGTNVSIQTSDQVLIEGTSTRQTSNFKVILVDTGMLYVKI